MELRKIKSLCNTCLKKIDGKVVIEDENVYLIKECNEHGTQKVLISKDKEYYLQCENTLISQCSFIPKEQLKPLHCPENCGICKLHKQHCGMAMLELTDDCNMKCSTCIASSYPGASKHKSFKLICEMIDRIVEQENNNLDLLMLTGGEPTIHPDLLKVIEYCKKKSIKHVMIISNGLKFSNDESFTQSLSKYADYIEIYLQFDAMNREAIYDVRGLDLYPVRKKAIESLERNHIYYTLISVVKKNSTAKYIVDTIEFGIRSEFCRGVTFQPIRATGRDEAYDFEDVFFLDEIRNCVIEKFNFQNEEFIPNPISPHEISILYFSKQQKKSITRELYNSVEGLENKIYMLPTDSSGYQYKDIFRIAIVSFLDKYCFDFDIVKTSPIHFIDKELNVIPFDTYYLFYKEV